MANNDVVMMLTERGMKILLEELSKGGNTQDVFTRLAEPEPSQEEVDEYVNGYLEHKKQEQPNYNENDEDSQIVVEYLLQEGKPVKLRSIREHLTQHGIYWGTKISTYRMKMVMKDNPNIVSAGFGMYEHIGGESIERNDEEAEVGEV